MANDTTVIQRADKFGIGTTYNPYKNAISTTNLPKQRFKIADTPTYADSPVIIVSTGLVPNLQDFVGGNIVFTIYDTDGTTLLETLIPKAVDIGEGLFPANNEINWFDVVGMQGDFYVNQVWAGKILEITGSFETCSITAEDINRMTSDINRMALDIRQLASRQPQVKRFLITDINIMNYQQGLNFVRNYEYKQYTDVIGLFRQRHPNERGEVLFWNLVPTGFTATATAHAYASASASASAHAELIYNASAHAYASASAHATANSTANSTATAEIKPLSLSGGATTLEVIAKATTNGYGLSCNFNITAAFWYTVLSM